MKVHFAIWIFISALFLRQFYSSADTNVTDSAVLNLILENSTLTNFEKELKSTRYNASDLFVSNTTASSLSSSFNDECKSGNCDKNVNSSNSSNSPTSKVLWNLVSMSKSTTTHHLLNGEIGVEEQTFSSSALGIHSSTNHSSVYNSSLHSSDNELDSDIKFENIDYVLHDEDMTDISTSNQPYLDYNSTTLEYMHMTTEISLNPFDSFDENSTYDSEAKELLETMLYTVTLDPGNTTALDSSEIISSPTDDEIDFTTYFSTFNSNEENRTETYDSVNYVPFGFIDSDSKEMNAKDDGIETDNTINNVPSNITTYDTSVKEVTIEDDNTTCKMDCYNSESYAPLSSDDDKYNTPPTMNTEGSTENNHHIDTESYDSVRYSTEEFVSKSSGVSLLYDYDEYNASNNLNHDNASESVIHKSKDSEIMNTTSNTNTYILLNTFYPTSAETTSADDNAETVKDIFSTTNTTYFNTDILFITNESMINNDLNSDNFSDDKLAAVSTENKLHINESEVFENSQNASNATNEFSLNEMTSDIGEFTEVTDHYPDFSHETETSTTVSDIFTAVLGGSRSYRTDDFIGHSQARSNPVASQDVSQSEISTEYVSSTVTSSEADISEKNSLLIHNSENFSVTTDVDPNINEVLLSSSEIISTEPAYLNNLNEISKHLSSSHIVTTVSPNSISEDKTSLLYISNTLSTLSTSTENNFETNIPILSSNRILTSTEREIENDVVSTGHVAKQLNTGYTISEIENKEIETTTSSSISEDTLYSVDNGNISSSDAVTDSDGRKPTTGYSFTETLPANTDSKLKTIAYPTETKIDSVPESSETADTANEEKNFDTISVYTTHRIEVTSSVEISSSDYSETHREGKHIPFSSTLVKSTTAVPIIYNITVGTFPRQPAPETTERDFIHLLYNQIRPEDLSSEERSNLVNAVIKIPDKFYSKEELNEKIAIIHLWLLHAIADEYKNATFNLSGANENQLHDVEFENLPEILYVLPTPDIFLPNISLTFIVHNRWRNATFPAEIIAAILNLHTEDLKHLVEIEEIHFSQGLLVQKADLFSVIIEKYGIILLATCLITVGMILLLICVVIYYRRKNRHSAHCLTDDKLHRNMQEAMGIDLNPAVIILQDEIREKAALNGNKISSLDDDEGWLAPIGDVPVAEDNNAPFVQDTKL